MEFLKKHKVWIAVILAVVVAIIVFYYYSKAIGKSEGIKSLLPDIPGDPTTVVASTVDAGNNTNVLLDAEKIVIKQLADRINVDINDMTPWWRDSAAYDQLAAASDRILVGVYNYYYITFNTSIISDIEQETSISPFVVDSTRTILKRMKELKLK